MTTVKGIIHIHYVLEVSPTPILRRWVAAPSADCVTLLFNPQMLASAHHTFVNAFKDTIILKPILSNSWNLDPSDF